MWKADETGLHSEDYDAPRCEARLGRLSAAPEAEQARFDAALTVCFMRYISDVHIGRVNPQHFHFGLDVEHKKYDLPDFLQQRLTNAPGAKAILDQVEPPFAGYKRTKAALAHYFELGRQDDGEQLPVPAFFEDITAWMPACKERRQKAILIPVSMSRQK